MAFRLPGYETLLLSHIRVEKGKPKNWTDSPLNMLIFPCYSNHITPHLGHKQGGYNAKQPTCMRPSDQRERLYLLEDSWATDILCDGINSLISRFLNHAASR